MVDCKLMTTPMELDFKKLSVSAAGPVLRNATQYRQLVGALMFLVNSHPDICVAVSTLSESGMTHSETDFGSVEDGMIHPRSFLLFHS